MADGHGKARWGFWAATLLPLPVVYVVASGPTKGVIVRVFGWNGSEPSWALWAWLWLYAPLTDLRFEHPWWDEWYTWYVNLFLG